MKDYLKEDFIAYEKDLDFCKSRINNSIFLITGSTGLIGSILCKYLIFTCPDVKIIAPIRNLVKAESIFDNYQKQHIEFKVEDIASCDYAQFASSCDYIIHCASPTGSMYFVEHPVETFESIINGTATILKFAKNCHNLKSFIFLSSLEVYGDVLDKNLIIHEDFQGYLSIDNIRSSYPMAKRAAENLCILYNGEYNVPIKIARLTQVTGPGIDINDNRILAQFCKCKARKEEIVLNSQGKSSRPYCYTMDAIIAIFKILMDGKDGMSYNVANDTTYISAYDLAEKVSCIYPSTNFRINIDTNKGYANETYHHLCSQRLRALGWNPKMDLDSIITRLICYIKDYYERN